MSFSSERHDRYAQYFRTTFVVIIIGMTQLLALFLSRIRQPRVIAEVIGGVLLVSFLPLLVHKRCDSLFRKGPTVMGRIPNFTNTIFPKDSLTMLTLTSTIGLVMFLFLVGIEIDMSVVKRNAKASAAISAAGLIIPLGLGAAIAIPIYHEFTDPSVNYGYFILFVAVAVGITVRIDRLRDAFVQETDRILPLQ